MLYVQCLNFYMLNFWHVFYILGINYSCWPAFVNIKGKIPFILLFSNIVMEAFTCSLHVIINMRLGLVQMCIPFQIYSQRNCWIFQSICCFMSFILTYDGEWHNQSTTSIKPALHSRIKSCNVSTFGLDYPVSFSISVCWLLPVALERRGRCICASWWCVLSAEAASRSVGC